jgi:hypothetical protein
VEQTGQTFQVHLRNGANSELHFALYCFGGRRGPISIRNPIHPFTCIEICAKKVPVQDWNVPGHCGGRERG